LVSGPLVACMSMGIGTTIHPMKQAFDDGMGLR